jgi:phospholipase/carboxylesterase
MSRTHDGDDPHDLEPVTAAATLEDATAAVVMVHGRGATPESMLPMREEFPRDDVAYLAPRAANNTWYPYSFMEPVERNEPGRSSGLRAIDRLVERADDASIPPTEVLVMGFSQGACLASEYVARNPRRYGGLAALSGGLIGEELGDYEGGEPNGARRTSSDERSESDGNLEGTPVFLGCSDVDPHIPLERVHETRDVFESLNADVDERIYEGMGHGVDADETVAVADIVADL